MADTLQVEVVAADRLVWSGTATVVNARTAGGEIGILANHMPVLSLLDPGAVEVETDGEKLTVAVDDGILSVANNRVSVLASHAELASDIDLSSARSELESRPGRRPRLAGRAAPSRGARARGREARLTLRRREGPPDSGAALVRVSSISYAVTSPHGGSRRRCRYGNGCWTQPVPCCWSCWGSGSCSCCDGG